MLGIQRLTSNGCPAWRQSESELGHQATEVRAGFPAMNSLRALNAVHDMNGACHEHPNLFVTSQGRVGFVTGDVRTTDQGQYDPKVYIAISPLMAYIGENFSIWRCPSDPSHAANGQPRVRSISMSHIFSNGGFAKAIAGATSRALAADSDVQRRGALVESLELRGAGVVRGVEAAGI